MILAANHTVCETTEPLALTVTCMFAFEFNPQITGPAGLENEVFVDEGDTVSPEKLFPTLKRSLSDNNLSGMSSLQRSSFKKKVKDGK